MTEIFPNFASYLFNTQEEFECFEYISYEKWFLFGLSPSLSTSLSPSPCLPSLSSN